MIDFATLFEMAGSIAIVTVPAILLNRLLAGAERGSLADILAIPLDPPWPRGAQEEEPVRWNVEALHPRRAAERAAGAHEPRRAGRPAVGLGTETGRCA